MADGIECNIAHAVASTPCLMLPCMNKQQRTAIRLYALASIIAELGGDPQDDFDEADATPPQFNNSESMDAALTALYLNLAGSIEGITVPSDPNELAALVKCYECAPNMNVRELALLCHMLSLLAAEAFGPR